MLSVAKSAHALLYAFALGAMDAPVLVSPRGPMARHLRKLRALADTTLVFAGRITRRRLRLQRKGHGGREEDSRKYEASREPLYWKPPGLVCGR
jgi:hypothetical protein